MPMSWMWRPLSLRCVLSSIREGDAGDAGGGGVVLPGRLTDVDSECWAVDFSTSEANGEGETGVTAIVGDCFVLFFSLFWGVIDVQPIGLCRSVKQGEKKKLSHNVVPRREGSGSVHATTKAKVEARAAAQRFEKKKEKFGFE